MASTSRNSDGIIDETDDLAHLEFGNGQNDFQDIIDELQNQIVEPAPESSKSKVWHYYKRLEIGDPLYDKKAICNFQIDEDRICGSVQDRSGGSTSNMIRHLKSKHGVDPGCKQKAMYEANSLQPPSKRARITETNPLKTKEIDDLYTKFICKDYMPFSTSSSPYFKALISALNPDYELPSRTALSETLVPNLALKIEQDMVTNLANAVYVSLTSDTWTSKATENYEAVSAHFIDEEFKFRSCTLGIGQLEDATAAGHFDFIRDLLERHDGLRQKVVAICTDNAEVMKLTASLLKFTWFGCFPHTLNLVIKDGFKHVYLQKPINMVRAIASYFNRSAKACDALKNLQKSKNLKLLILIRDTDTRWSSTLAMLKRFIKIEQLLHQVVTELKIHQLNWPSISEMKELKMIVEIFEPFQVLTTMMSSETNVTASSVIYIAEELVRHTTEMREKCKEDYPKAYDLSDRMRKSMLERDVTSYSSKDDVLIATVLDPRFKLHGFMNPETARAAKDLVYSAAESINLATEEQKPIHEVKRSFFERLKRGAAFSQSNTAKQPSARFEVEKYLSETALDLEKDPLEWWKEKTDQYPHMTILVKKYLSMIVNSVPCERIFSKMGQIITDRRTNLRAHKASMIGMVASNLPTIPEQ